MWTNLKPLQIFVVFIFVNVLETRVRGEATLNDIRAASADYRNESEATANGWRKWSRTMTVTVRMPAWRHCYNLKLVARNQHDIMCFQRKQNFGWGWKFAKLFNQEKSFCIAKLGLCVWQYQFCDECAIFLDIFGNFLQSRRVRFAFAGSRVP